MKDSDESTPTTNALNPNNEVKCDKGKTRVGLVLGDFAEALYEVSRVGTFGAKKYSPHGWKTVPNALERYEDALMRHYLEYKQGKIYDEESGLHHLSHMAWNALAFLSFELEAISNQKPHVTTIATALGRCYSEQLHPTTIRTSSDTIPTK